MKKKENVYSSVKFTWFSPHPTTMLRYMLITRETKVLSPPIPRQCFARALDRASEEDTQLMMSYIDGIGFHKK